MKRLLAATVGLMLVGVPVIHPAPAYAVAREAAAVSRLEFVVALYPFVQTLTYKRIVEPPAAHSINIYTDLDNYYRNQVLNLANRYNLFEGIPEVSGDRFKGEKPLSRYEAALILGNLLRLCRLDLSDLPDRSFKDLSTVEHQSIAGVLRTGLMEGFPDKSFRAAEPLTRGQLSLVMGELERFADKPPVLQASGKTPEAERLAQEFEYKLFAKEFPLAAEAAGLIRIVDHDYGQAIAGAAIVNGKGTVVGTTDAYGRIDLGALRRDPSLRIQASGYEDRPIPNDSATVDLYRKGAVFKPVTATPGPKPTPAPKATPKPSPEPTAKPSAAATPAATANPATKTNPAAKATPAATATPSASPSPTPRP